MLMVKWTTVSKAWLFALMRCWAICRLEKLWCRHWLFTKCSMRWLVRRNSWFFLSVKRLWRKGTLLLVFGIRDLPCRHLKLDRIQSVVVRVFDTFIAACSISSTWGFDCFRDWQKTAIVWNHFLGSHFIHLVRIGAECARISAQITWIAID